MRFTREELKRLMLPLALAVTLLGAGAALIWSADGALRAAQGQLAGAQAERRQNNERLARISEEEREVSEKIDVPTAGTISSTMNTASAGTRQTYGQIPAVRPKRQLLSQNRAADGRPPAEL